MIPENMRIEFPKVNGGFAAGAGTPMKELVDYVDRCYAIRLLGQNTSTEGVSGTGTLAGGAHENVRKDYLRSDAKALAAVVEEDVFRPIVGFNLGWDYPLPKMWFDVDDAQDDESRAKVYVEMAKIPGMEFSKSQIQEEFNFREALDDDDRITIQLGEDTQIAEEEDAFTAIARRFSTKDDLNPRRGEGELSSGAKASKSLTIDSIEQAQEDLISTVFELVAALADDVETPEQLLRRIKLAAPNLDEALEAANLSLDDVEDVIARAYHTSWYNGTAAVENESELQLKAEKKLREEEE
jgi:phage gp29-like protein